MHSQNPVHNAIICILYNCIYITPVGEFFVLCKLVKFERVREYKQKQDFTNVAYSI